LPIFPHRGNGFGEIRPTHLFDGRIVALAKGEGK